VTPARATAFLVIVCALYFVLCLLAWGRSVMESERAIADVILVTRAETTYATLNGGFSEGNLSCLERPGTCVPSAPAEWAGLTVAPTPLDPPLSARSHPGLGRWFISGPPADRNRVKLQDLSQSSIQGFAYIAATRPPAWWTRLAPLKQPPAGFCGDSSGVVCALDELPAASYDQPRCPTGCKS
jgi:hypothetical protein